MVGLSLSAGIGRFATIVVAVGLEIAGAIVLITGHCVSKFEPRRLYLKNWKKFCSLGGVLFDSSGEAYIRIRVDGWESHVYLYFGKDGVWVKQL